jgi:hypothetical protein
LEFFLSVAFQIGKVSEVLITIFIRYLLFKKSLSGRN